MGSHAVTAQARSVRDREERKSAWTWAHGSKHPVLFMSMPGPACLLPCLGKEETASCLGPEPRLCGWEKKEPRRVQVIRPENPRQHSEISTGSHALTAQARSERDRLERKHVDHWTRIEAPRAFPPHARSSVPTAVPREKRSPRCGRRGRSGQLEHEASPV